MSFNTITGEEIKLSAERERVNLFEHGTKVADITPRNIVQAAERDLRERVFNKERHAIGDPMRRYLFPGRIVRAATSAGDLLRRVAEEQPTPTRAVQMYLFGDIAKVRAAAELALEAEATASE